MARMLHVNCVRHGLWLVFTLGIISFFSGAEAAVMCNGTHNICEDLLWKGSKCRDCLRAMLDSDEYENIYSSGSAQALHRRLLDRPHVSNSKDTPDVIERGLCVQTRTNILKVGSILKIGNHLLY